jgi:RNA polymerase sigma factor (TIGR02999 family)
MTEDHDITRLLADLRHGDEAAFDRLFNVVYEELRRRAHYQLRESKDATLMTTDLVHEAYLKLAGSASSDWEDRRHFYRVAARAMRQIVVDRARKHLTVKRGGGGAILDIDRVSIPVHDASEQLVAMDRALVRLEQESARAARVIELTYFVGLSIEEAAHTLDSSARTVKRLRQFGRAFLHRHLSENPASSDETAS